MLESCSWLAQIQKKKELPKTYGLGPRYKESYRVGVHVDISTHWQEGVNRPSLGLTRPKLGLTGPYFGLTVSNWTQIRPSNTQIRPSEAQ